MTLPAQEEIHAFVKAAGDGKIDDVRAFVALYPDAINEQNNHGTPALVFAAYDGCDDVIAFLLDCGANLEVRTRDGMTPLIAAAIHAPMATTQLLRARGADETLRDDKGRNARDIAAHWNRADLVALYDASAKAAEQALDKLRDRKPRNPFGRP